MSCQTIHCIAGLPASGKSYLARQIARESGAAIIDDPKGILDVKPIILENPDKDFIICDPYFCEPKVRERATKQLLDLLPGAKLQWYYFENNAEQCRKNVEYRNDGRKVEASIRRFGKSYRIPDGVDVIPVWRP